MRLHSFAIFDRGGTLDIPWYTCVSSPFPRPLLCILPSFFFISRISRVEIWHSIFALLWSPRRVPASPLSRCFLLFSYHSLSLSSLSRLLHVVFASLIPLSLSLSLVVGTIKKNSQVSFAPIAAFILSIGLYLIRRILASYYVRGNVKAN